MSSALLKGIIMGAFGVGVVIQVVVKIRYGLSSSAEIMGVVGGARIRREPVLSGGAVETA